MDEHGFGCSFCCGSGICMARGSEWMGLLLALYTCSFGQGVHTYAYLWILTLCM